MKSAARIAILCLAAALVTGLGAVRSSAREGNSGKLSEVLTTYWALPKEGSSITLIVSGEKALLTFAVEHDLAMSGNCHDCNMMLRFKPDEAGKRCNMCPCDVSFAECIAWKSLKPNGWQTMLQALPRGTALHVVFRTKGKPESGLVSLNVDRRMVLAPVEGLDRLSADQLLALVRPFGGTSAALTADGKQLVIELKEDWSVEKEAKFEKAVAAQGGKLVWNTAETDQK